MGAQNRYRLVTSIAGMSSRSIAIPIGVIMSVWLRMDLQGLAFAMVTGETATETLLTLYVIMLDWEWEKLSVKFQIPGDGMEEEVLDSESSSDDSSLSLIFELGVIAVIVIIVCVVKLNQ